MRSRADIHSPDKSRRRKLINAPAERPNLYGEGRPLSPGFNKPSSTFSNHLGRGNSIQTTPFLKSSYRPLQLCETFLSRCDEIHVEAIYPWLSNRHEIPTLLANNGRTHTHVYHQATWKYALCFFSTTTRWRQAAWRILNNNDTFDWNGQSSRTLSFSESRNNEKRFKKEVKNQK